MIPPFMRKPRVRVMQPTVYTNMERVVFQPATYRGMQRGINQLVNAIRPTLGPRPRVVAIDHVDYHDKTPRLLDDGGTIARLIIELPDRDADVGAMFLRDVLWRLQQQVGDGTATAAVLFQAVFERGVHYITAGGNPRRLQTFLEQGLRTILEQLNAMVVHLSGREELAHIAETVCYDPPLASMLGEIFDIVGEFGRVEIRPGRSRELEREYVEGMYWERGAVSRGMLDGDGQLRTDLEESAILISDLEIKHPQQLYPPLALVIRHNIRSLLMVVGEISDSAIGFLLSNKHPEKLRVVAVKTPGWDKEQKAWALEDLAVLTGGRVFVQAAGDTFERVRRENLGFARRAWADRHNFGIIGGKGNARQLRQHIATIRAAFEHTDNPNTRNLLRERIGKLLGGSATLWVGGMTQHEINERVERAKRAATALRGALREGVLPGGGVALLNCRPALEARARTATDPDERAAYRILAEAVAAPIRAIITNAGFDASETLAELKQHGPGYGFDVVRERVLPMAEAGIYDPAIVTKSVAYTAITSAAQALTIDVMVHHAQPEQAPLPDLSPSKQL
ncbi:MAG: chaperonin GroEL [Anaerolineae bacterium]